MKNHMFCRPVVLALTVSCLFLSGCTKSGGGGDDDSSEFSGSNNGGVSGSGSVRTNCGVVQGGELKNPVDLSDGQVVQVVDVLSSNLLLVQSSGSDQVTLIKLQGVGGSKSDSKAVSHISSLIGGGAVFFKATKDCDAVLRGGAHGTIGSLITFGGTSVGESVLSKGLASADSNDACRGDLLGACMAAIADDAEPEPLPTPEPTDEALGEVSPGFLWKPVSDSDGRTAVHVQECDVVIRVNGQVFSENQGAGNGRCSLFRLPKPGCAYGQARVEVFDKYSGLPYNFKGKPFLILNGCQRYEMPGYLG